MNAAALALVRRVLRGLLRFLDDLFPPSDRD